MEFDIANEELAIFDQSGYVNEMVEICIYKLDVKTRYIYISDHQCNRFQKFTREGTSNYSHDQELVKIVKVASIDSDDSKILAKNLSSLFHNGFFRSDVY